MKFDESKTNKLTNEEAIKLMKWINFFYSEKSAEDAQRFVI